MQEVLTLIKMFSDSGAGWSSKGDSEKKKKTNKIVAAFLLLVALPFATTLGIVGYYMTMILKDYNQTHIVLQLGMIISCLFMFFFGLLMIPSTFYFTDDIEALIPMPIKTSNIFISKLVVTYFWENLSAVFTFIPVMVGYAMIMKPGILFWINGLIVSALISIIPLTYGIIITILLIRFTSFGRNKLAISYTMSGVSLLVSTLISVYLVAQLISGEDIMLNLILSSTSFIKFFENLFPMILNWGPLSMMTGEIHYSLLYITINAVAFGLCIVFAKLFYHQGLMNLTGGSNHKRVVNDKWIQKRIKKLPIQTTIIKKDLITLFTNPAFFSGCITPCIIVPLLLVAISLTSTKDVLQEYFFVIPDFLLNIYVYASTAILAIVSSGMNYIAPTAISREGADYQAMKYFPVPYEEQVFAKMKTGLLISIVSYIISLAALRLIVPFTLKPFIFGFIVGIAAIYILNVIGIWLDLFNPTVIWLDEQKAVKQNFNGMIIIVLSILLATLLGYIAMTYYADIYNISVGITCILVAVGAAISYHLNENSYQYFKKM